MPSTPIASPELRVVAVLVAHNGAEWLPRALAALTASRHRALEVVAVNSGSADATGAILARELPAQQVITLERNQGFAPAVAAAASTEAVRRADLVLLLHDDLLLEPDAIPALVDALAGDATLGAVGPKLLSWGPDRMLQEVGLTVDRLGRVESDLEPGELDQGQHDATRDVLFVSSAGLMVRRELLDRLGGFDGRYPAFREDLDLCWRIWLSGQRVAVVPAAVGHHVAAASRFLRPVGRGRRWEPRYFAERHTLATLLKSYGAARLVWVLPLLLVVAAGKVLGFLLTRRLGDAAATVRAYAWNLVQLPRTLRLRRAVQRTRAVGDGEIAALLAPGLPRVRAYAGAMSSWLAGGGTRALLDEPEVRRRRADRAWRQRPVVLLGIVLLLAYLVGVAPLLGPGQLVGGEIAPWPASAVDFLRAYASPWGAEPLAAAAFSSPAQAVLGVVSLLGLGSAWAAQRIVVLGLVPLSWLLAVRAGRMLTPRPGPRAVGATLYVISPAVLGALGEGRLGVLVVAALLPALVLVGVRAVDPGAGAAGGWRAAALLAVGLAIAGAAAPPLLPLLTVLWALLLLAALVRGRRGAAAAGRALAGGGLALLLLGPWLLDLVAAGWTQAAPVGVDLPLWRALALAPLVPVAPVGVGAVVLASTAVVLGALVLGLRSRPGLVAVLVAAWACSSLAAWVVAAQPVAGVWAPALLLPAVLARAALGVLVARWLLERLSTVSFGLAEVGHAFLAAVLLLGLAGGVVRLGEGPADGLQRDPVLLPAFVAAEPDRVGPYRVVVLDQEGGTVRWDVTDAGGPSMLAFGTVPDRGLEQLIERAVAGAVSGADPGAGAELGRANVRYLVVHDAAASPELVAAIDRQAALEPLPAGGVSIWQVRSWLPRAAVLPEEQAEALRADGDPGDTEAIEEHGLRPAGPGRFAGSLRPGSDLVVLAEGVDAAWSAVDDTGRPLTPLALGGVQGFAVPPGAARVLLEVQGRTAHLLAVAWQALLLLGIASLVLRPPGGRQRRRPTAPQPPGALTAGPDLTPTEGSIVPRPLADRRAAGAAPDGPTVDRDVTGGAR